jgi:hypothetical protein
MVFALGALGLVGTMIVRRARNQVGWNFVVLGASAALTGLSGALVSLDSLYEIPWPEWWMWWNDTGFIVAALALPPLFLTFPNGHLPSRRWRWVAWLYATGVAIWLVWLFTAQERHDSYRNPTFIASFTPIQPVLLNVGAAIVLGAALACIAALFVRYHRSTGESRLQIRWVVAVVGAGTACLLLSWLVVLTPLPVEVKDKISGVFFLLIFFLAVLGLPLAVTIAVFRYKLYEIDVVIRKTIVVGGLAVFITLVYVAVVGIVSSRLPSSTSSFVAAVLLALLFQPARERARRFADRVIYGKRATPYEVLTAFRGRMGGAYSTEDVMPRMAEVLAAGTGASSIRVLVRVGAGLQEAAATGEPEGGEHVTPVIHQGEELGQIATTFPPAEPLDAAKEQLIADLADQAGHVLRNAKLIEELRASRQAWSQLKMRSGARSNGTCTMGSNNSSWP